MTNFCPHFVHKNEIRTKINIYKQCVQERKGYCLEVLCCAIGMGNNPMVGATVACAVAVEEASK